MRSENLKSSSEGKGKIMNPRRRQRKRERQMRSSQATRRKTIEK